MYNMFDEDNIDLEEQMYLQEVQDELDEIEEENEEEEIEEDIFDDYDLNRKFLDNQLTLKTSDKREITVLHKKTGKIFKGIVLGKSTTDKDKYVFSMSEVIDNKTESEKKNKIFNFADIKKYKK